MILSVCAQGDRRITNHNPSDLWLLVTWGDPARETGALLDRECPNCSHRPGDDVPFEEGITAVEGDTFGFYCHNCGYGMVVSEKYL